MHTHQQNQVPSQPTFFAHLIVIYHFVYCPAYFIFIFILMQPLYMHNQASEESKTRFPHDQLFFLSSHLISSHRCSLFHLCMACFLIFFFLIFVILMQPVYMHKQASEQARKAKPGFPNQLYLTFIHSCTLP